MKEELKNKRVYAEVDLAAIKRNVKNLHDLTRPDTKMMAIIKANAYGHGAVEVAKALEQDVYGFGIAIVEEGMELRKAGIKNPILILGYTMKNMLQDVVENDLIQTVFQYDTAAELDRIAAEKGKKVRIHIKIDTGMGRIGFPVVKESIEDIVRISKLENIEINGVFSHFAKADEFDKESAKKQFERFCSMTADLEKEGIHIPIRHISNTAAVIDLPEMNLDMVRCGIGIYGLYPSEEVEKSKVELIPAMSIKSHISNIKQVPKGTGISYGWTFITDKDSRIATIPIGYGDGYPRRLSSIGKVILHGNYAPIAGRVCMDQFMVDVTDIENVSQEDTVTIVGREKEAVITVEYLSELAGTFNYEFVCDVGRRIPRVYRS